MKQSKGVIDSDGRERSYLLSEPTEGNPRALMMALHGSTQRGSLIRRTSGFDVLVDDESIAVVYPDAFEGLWRDGRSEDDVDDVTFLSELIEELTGTLNIDSKNVVIAGASNGGFMVQRLLCEMPEIACAGASIISTMGADIFRACFPDHVVSMLMVAAKDDIIVPYEGGHVVRADGGGYRGLTISFDDAVEFWVSQGDWVTQGDVIERELEEGVSLREQNYMSENHKERFKVVSLKGVGHHWFGREMPESLERMFGKTTLKYDVSNEVWGFFNESLATN